MIDPRAHAKAMWESTEYTMRDIAACVGVEVSVLRVWKREDHWRTDFEPVEYPKAVRDEALRAVASKMPVAAVARKLGVGRTTILRWLDGQTATAWRCGCTEYGGALRSEECPLCHRRAPFL